MQFVLNGLNSALAVKSSQNVKITRWTQAMGRKDR